MSSVGRESESSEWWRVRRFKAAAVVMVLSFTGAKDNDDIDDWRREVMTGDAVVSERSEFVVGIRRIFALAGPAVCSQFQLRLFVHV